MFASFIPLLKGVPVFIGFFLGLLSVIVALSYGRDYHTVVLGIFQKLW
jgi:hypothetical protein